MRYAAFVFLLAALTAPAGAAQSSSSYKTCTAKATTQLALNSCASAEDARVNAQMNALYAKVLLHAGTQEGGVQKVKAAQAAWIAYRNAAIAAAFPASNKQQQYGSMYTMRVNLLYASLTTQHIADLNLLLDSLSGE